MKFMKEELLAIVHCVKKWTNYLDGSKFMIKTDHHSLQSIKNNAFTSKRSMKLIQKLQPYNNDISYIPGKENVTADILSRNEYNLLEYTDWPTFILNYIEDNTLPTEEKHFEKILKKEKNNFRFDDVEEKLYRKFNGKDVAFIPFVFRADLVQLYHSSYGHLAFEGILEIMQERFWWPGMHNDMKKWIQTCYACQLEKDKPRIQEALRPRLPIAPFARWSIDFIGRLPPTLHGNKWLLVAVDNFTKWPIARAISEATSSNVAKFIYEEIVLPFACPEEILSDRAKNFRAEELENYLSTLNVKHKLTSAYHPRSNGAVERLNRVFNGILTKYCEGHPKRWDEFIEQTLFTCRIRKHSATGISPFELVYGIKPKLPGDIITPHFILPDEDVSTDERKIDLLKLQESRAKMKQTLTRNAELMKDYFDRTNNLLDESKFNEEDVVLLSNEKTGKFQPNWKGPYIIKRVFPLGTYQISDKDGNIREDLVHGDRLKKAFCFVKDRPDPLAESFSREGENGLNIAMTSIPRQGSFF